MEDTPNVNNLNGVPNFGHGFPQDVPAEVAEEAVVAAEPEAALEVAEEVPEVDITSVNQE